MNIKKTIVDRLRNAGVWDQVAASRDLKGEHQSRVRFIGPILTNDISTYRGPVDRITPR